MIETLIPFFLGMMFTMIVFAAAWWMFRAVDSKELSVNQGVSAEEFDALCRIVHDLGKHQRKEG